MFDVAITTYKRPALVCAAVKSCLVQGPLLGKVIVVDDASADGTGEAVQSLCDLRILFFQRAKNGGISAARRDAFSLSTAAWTVSLDSDHELLPRALEAFSGLVCSAAEPVDILGGRYRWDTGRVSPESVPQGVLGYRDRIHYSAVPKGIGSDYLCAVSARVRQAVSWEPLRSGLVDTLFQLDAASVGKAIFTSQCLAFQKSDAAHGYTRGTAAERWARRRLDATDAVQAARAILDRHGEALSRWGPRLLAQVARQGAFFALLIGERSLARRWLAIAIKANALDYHALALELISVLPVTAIGMLYRARGKR
jgi:glycosyltransferase involved in cell wall biosynthesis